jgi:hypothetical protein
LAGAASAFGASYFQEPFWSARSASPARNAEGFTRDPVPASEPAEAAAATGAAEAATALPEADASEAVAPVEAAAAAEPVAAAAGAAADAPPEAAAELPVPALTDVPAPLPLHKIQFSKSPSTTVSAKAVQKAVPPCHWPMNRNITNATMPMAAAKSQAPSEQFRVPFGCVMTSLSLLLI